MARTPYHVGGRSFSSQKELVAHIRGIVAAYQDGEYVNDTDRPFLLDLFTCHPEWPQKRGDSDQLWVKVDAVPPYFTRCFVIVRADGSSTDISWTECVRPSSAAERVSRAFRNAIRDQKDAFKADFFAGPGPHTCPLSGELLTPDNAHVDHEDPTFDALVRAFLATRTLTPEQVALRPTVDGGTDGDWLGDAVLSDAFAAFHEARATLRVISKSENLRRSRSPQAA
jgi:uncharacterized protein DUF3223